MPKASRDEFVDLINTIAREGLEDRDRIQRILARDQAERSRDLAMLNQWPQVMAGLRKALARLFSEWLDGGGVVMGQGSFKVGPTQAPQDLIFIEVQTVELKIGVWGIDFAPYGVELDRGFHLVRARTRSGEAFLARSAQGEWREVLSVEPWSLGARGDEALRICISSLLKCNR